jgi:hypothetical protein
MHVYERQCLRGFFPAQITYHRFSDPAARHTFRGCILPELNVPQLVSKTEGLERRKTSILFFSFAADLKK